MKCRRINLDKLRLDNMKHADYVLVKDDEVIIVEETGTAEIRDVEKLEETIELVRQGRIQGVSKDPPRRIKAVLHAKRRVPPHVAKAMRDKSRHGYPYYIANCYDMVREITGCQ